MTRWEQQSEGSTDNEFGGTADNVVQAGHIHGGVHFHQRAAKRSPVLRQLPPDVSHFTGRDADLAELDAFLVEGNGPPAAAVIAGTAGVGKTALALRWARQVRDRFPDGELYANLHGYDPGPPLRPEQVMNGFLRALDVPLKQIPPMLEEQVGLYRSLLDGRRVLVLLDNAATAEQVRPLLPGSPGCLAVVTSRSRLSGLVARDGALRLTLEPLPLTKAIALLRQVVGTDRVDREPEIAAKLAGWCAYLPLALRIAAERVLAHPRVTLADLAGELANEHKRLDLLATGGDEPSAVRVVFSWSYRDLPSDVARVFRLLGLHPGPDISTPAAAAVGGATFDDIRSILDALTGVHLLEETGRDRYQFHDLLRFYAKDRAENEETAADRDAATDRLLDHYLTYARGAGQHLDPQASQRRSTQFDTREQALAWLDLERPNLVAAVALAARTGRHAHVRDMANALVWYFDLRKHWDDWISTHQLALTATRHLGEREGEGRILTSLGNAYREVRRHDEAITCQEESVSVFREIGDRYREGEALTNLGNAHCHMRRFEESITCYEQALEIFRELGDRYGEGEALNNVGNAYREVRRFEESVACHEQAWEIRRELGDRYHEGRNLNNLGLVYREVRRFDEAITAHQLSLQISREIGDRYGEALALNNGGLVYGEMGRFEDAITGYRQALEIFRELGDLYREGDVLTNLGVAHRAVGQAEEAQHCWERALVGFEDTHDPDAVHNADRVRTLLRQLDQST